MVWEPAMKVFLSSVIAGFELYRDAAALAITTLGHQTVRAEDFGATPQSPQQTCLAGVRDSDLVVLVLGARYGFRQASGRSATHEEFDEARHHRPLLAFVQDGVERDADQETFVRTVEEWGTGNFTARFRTPQELQTVVTRALHQWELAQAAGPLDEADLIERARSYVPQTSDAAVASLYLVVTGGPRQQVLRPAQMESSQLQEDLTKRALFGEHHLFTTSLATNAKVDHSTLTLSQGQVAITVDELGSVRLKLPTMRRREGVLELPVLVEEELRERVSHGLAFVTGVLDQIDPMNRLSDVVVIAALLGAGMHPWRTRAEHEQNPHGGMLGSGPDRAIVSLTPAQRHRAVWTVDRATLLDDLIVLLRREMRGRDDR